jgi:hypothetical protein
MPDATDTKKTAFSLPRGSAGQEEKTDELARMTHTQAMGTARQADGFSQQVVHLSPEPKELPEARGMNCGFLCRTVTF